MSETMTVDRLVRWCQGICNVPSVDPARIAHELGIPGDLVARGSGFDLEPPLPGTRRLKFSTHDDAFQYLEIEFEDTTLTRATIESWFGAGKDTPRVHWDSSYKLFYQIDHPGAPHGCDMFAEFAEQPEAHTTVIGILLRRRPSPG